MNKTRVITATLAALLVVALLLGNTGCLCSLILDELLGTPTPNPTGQPVSGTVIIPPPDVEPPRPPTRPANLTREVKTGTVTTGPATPLGTVTVPAQGGDFTLNSPGQPLDGLTVSVPPNAYSRPLDFAISSAPITATTFKNVNWATPLISVQNGGEYAASYIEVKLPFKTPPGKFAMGFIYDSKTGRLEGLPLADSTADSVTIATRHFTDFGLSLIDEAALQADIYSGFWPGFDDWEFTNYGSIIAPGGHCAGQSLSAMWYYITQPDGPNATLYNRYDNNRKQPLTPKVWQDDSFGYRFASTIQRDIPWDSILNAMWTDFRGKDDATTLRLFAYSMLVTNEPQMVTIGSATGGHAMICYRVNNGTLYLADPNYPGNQDRIIEFTQGAFKPYESGANAAEIAAGNSTKYDKIGYRAKSQAVEWQKIETRWQEFLKGTIGNDRFPTYQFTYFDEKGKEQTLVDGMTVKVAQLKFDLKVANRDSAVSFFRDGKLEKLGGYLAPLSKGQNNIGFAVWADYVDSNGKHSWKYVDFKHFNINSAPETPTPTPTLPATGALAKLQQTNRFTSYVSPPNAVWEYWDGKTTKTTDAFSTPSAHTSVKIPEWGNLKTGDNWFEITWSGTTFTGNVDYTNLNGDVFKAELKGNVSADGTTITTLTYTSSLNKRFIAREGGITDRAEKVSITMVNLPVWQEGDAKFEYSPTGLTQGTACADKITKNEHTAVESRQGQAVSRITLKNFTWEGVAGGSIDTHFFTK